MGNHERLAREFFHQGYNCSQAVFLAFCQDTGIDQETAARIASSFGGGLGRLREVCGALSGGCMVLGMLYGGFSPEDTAAKGEHYRRIQSYAEAFRQENGAILCRDLLHLSEDTPLSPIPDARTQAYYKKRPCEEMVACAARLLEEMIPSFQHESQNHP